MRQWRRRRGGWTENVGVALIAAGVGAATFYVTRLLVSREELDRRPPPGLLRESSGQGTKRVDGGDGPPSRSRDGGE